MVSKSGLKRKPATIKKEESGYSLDVNVCLLCKIRKPSDLRCCKSSSPICNRKKEIKRHNIK